MSLRLAFAGTGFISKVHALAAQHCGAELVAAVNRRPESLARFSQKYGIPRQYETVEAMLADGEVDALVISTPNYLHAPQTVDALKAGLHVLVEKPMAMNAVEAVEMCIAAEATGTILMVAHCWRFDPDVRWLKEQSSKLGCILRTKGYGVHTHWGPAGWFTQKQYAGGGALADMGVHALDTARFLLGDPLPINVYARIGCYYGDYDVDDTGLMLVTWENGISSYIESGWWQPHADGPEAATQLYGTQGFGQLFPTHLELSDRAHEKVERLESGFAFPRVEHCPQSLYDTQMRYFLDCVETGRTPVPGGREGLVNMQVIDAAYESAQTGQVVAIKT